jgi:DHA1 family bicyclomycin/chloramphenicol resistance-like MFS transporter
MTERISARAAVVATTAMSPAWLLALGAGLLTLQPLSTDLFQAALPAIGTDLNAPVARVQLMMTLFILVFGLWQLVAGPLSDRFGRRPVILAGLTVYVAASLVCMLAPSMNWLLIGRVGQALGACSCRVSARAMVRDALEPTQGARLLAAASTLLGIVTLAAPIIGSLLLTWSGWRADFAAMLLATCALLLAALARLRETLQTPNPDALRIAPMLRIYRQVLRTPAWHAYTWSAAFSYAGLFSFLSGGSFVLIRVLGLSPFACSLCFSTVVIGYTLGTLICRRAVQRLGLRRCLMVASRLQLAAALALIGLALAGVHHWAAIIGPHFLFMLAHGQLLPVAQAGSVAHFARNAGVATAAMGLAMMLVAAAVGQWLGASFNGTVYPLMLTMAASGIGTAASAWLLVRRDGDVG